MIMTKAELIARLDALNCDYFDVEIKQTGQGNSFEQLKFPERGINYGAVNHKEPDTFVLSIEYNL